MLRGFGRCVTCGYCLANGPHLRDEVLQFAPAVSHGLSGQAVDPDVRRRGNDLQAAAPDDLCGIDQVRPAQAAADLVIWVYVVSRLLSHVPLEVLGCELLRLDPRQPLQELVSFVGEQEDVPELNQLLGGFSQRGHDLGDEQPPVVHDPGKADQPLGLVHEEPAGVRGLVGDDGTLLVGVDGEFHDGTSYCGIVGWDRRRVGHSRSVSCLNSAPAEGDLIRRLIAGFARVRGWFRGQ